MIHLNFATRLALPGSKNRVELLPEWRNTGLGSNLGAKMTPGRGREISPCASLGRNDKGSEGSVEMTSRA